MSSGSQSQASSSSPTSGQMIPDNSQLLQILKIPAVTDSMIDTISHSDDFYGTTIHEEKDYLLIHCNLWNMWLNGVRAKHCAASILLYSWLINKKTFIVYEDGEESFIQSKYIFEHPIPQYNTVEQHYTMRFLNVIPHAIRSFSGYKHYLHQLYHRDYADLDDPVPAYLGDN